MFIIFYPIFCIFFDTVVFDERALIVLTKSILNVPSTAKYMVLPMVFTGHFEAIFYFSSGEFTWL